MTDDGLAGRVALVTGGSRGIGRAIAARFLRAGCRVAILSRDAASLDTGLRALQGIGEVTAVRADVGVRAEVDAAVRAVIDRFGTVDVLVNNAGITSRQALADLDDAHWDAVMRTNVKSLLHCCQAVVPGMKARRWGRIINCSSYAAWHAALARGVYAASKAAVNALTKVWAGELGPYGITVNAYAPGDIRTEMMADLLGPQEQRLTQRIALGRIGTVDEVADVVVFLASERAAYLTGIIVEISGGKYVVQNPWDAWPPQAATGGAEG
jgi:3-oxoacyl-[acyl-carrier protein] reductase